MRRALQDFASLFISRCVGTGVESKVGDNRKETLFLKRSNVATIFLLMLILTLFGANANAITLRAEIDKKVVVLGERLTYTITLESSSMSTPDIEPPVFEGFDIVMGPSTSTSVSMVGTQISKQSSLSYVLRATRVGMVTIPAAKVVHKRQTITSEAIEIEVLPSSTHTPSTTQPQRSQTQKQTPKTRTATPEMFLEAVVDKNEVWRLEMVTVTYRLYFRNEVSSYNLVKAPQATGFWVEEFSTPQRPVIRNTVIDGVSYRVADIRKVGLFPTRSGTLTLDPLVADIVVNLPVDRRRSRSIWDDPFFGGRRETVSLSTEPLEITVKPFPTVRQPTDFRGDAGDFQMRVEYDKTTVSQHDPITIKVTISGTGYIRSVDAPILNLPAGFEKFNPTLDQNINTGGDVMRGRKVFTYLVIPRRAGTYNLDPVRFSYFDIKSGNFKTLSQGGVMLTVSPSETYADPMTSVPTGRLGIEVMSQDIRFIKSMDEPFTKIQTPIYLRWWFYGAMGLSPLLFLMGLFVESAHNRRSTNIYGVKRRKASDELRKSIKHLEKMLKDSASDSKSLKDAIIEVNNNLLQLTSALIKKPAAGLTTELLQEELKNLKLSTEDASSIIQLNCQTDMCRFAGFDISTDVARNYLNKCIEISTKLEKI